MFMMEYPGFCFLRLWLTASLSLTQLIQIICASWVHNMSQKLHYTLMLFANSLSGSCQEPALKRKVNIPWYSNSLIWFHFLKKVLSVKGLREVYPEIICSYSLVYLLLLSFFRQADITIFKYFKLKK